MSGKAKVITFLIGNGFDIACLNAIGQDHKTTYKEFYNYTRWHLKKDNEFLKRMGDDLVLWNQFEKSFSKMIEKKREELKEIDDIVKQDELYIKIMNDWDDIQILFSNFINEVITPEVLQRAGKMAGDSLALDFLLDLKRGYNLYPDHYDDLDVNIINFNYSALFDNYIKGTDDPHPFKDSKNNYKFSYSTKKGESRVRYLKLRKCIFHPHGQVSIPSSMLIGKSSSKKQYLCSDARRTNLMYRPMMLEKRLNKVYWYQNDKYMEKEVANSDIFVSFGLSIGESDKYWWELVCRKVYQNQATKLFFYAFNDEKLVKQDKEVNIIDELLGYLTDEQKKDVQAVTNFKKSLSIIVFEDVKELKSHFNFEYTDVIKNNDVNKNDKA